MTDTTSSRRRPIPLRVKIEVVTTALIRKLSVFKFVLAGQHMADARTATERLARGLGMLGYAKGDAEFDHDPALGLRHWDASGGDFVPPQHHPSFIIVKTKAAHRHKTSGRKPGATKTATTYGSDVHAIAKLKRLTGPEKKPRSKIAQRKTAWPKRKLQSRNTFRKRER